MLGAKDTTTSPEGVPNLADTTDEPYGGAAVTLAGVSEAPPAAREPAVQPRGRAERISALDTLRGFALLGILLMNIVGFGLYHGSYDDPTVHGGATGWNLIAWVVLHILAEGKMRCLFTLSFGASAILLTSRLEGTGLGGDIYYRRTFWLLLFGLTHAYLLWYGDILFPYAICGLFLFPFRRLPARGLLALGLVLMVLLMAAYAGRGYMIGDTIAAGQAAEALAADGVELTKEQKKALEEWEEIRTVRRPTPDELQEHVEQWRGAPFDILKVRASLVAPFHSKPLYHPLFWDMLSMMFLGMGLMKLGFFEGNGTYRFYAGLAAAGYAIGIPVNAYSAKVLIDSDFDIITHALSYSTYDIGRLSIALGHFAVLMILCKAHAWRWITGPLAAIGQTAFSNYILQSILCTFLFTGMGLGLFGRLERYQLYYVVAGVWLIEWIVSPLWLRYYRFGPLEWAWRSLTYWKRQPMRLDRQNA
jgi:uncharacterized protein